MSSTQPELNYSHSDSIPPNPPRAESVDSDAAPPNANPAVDTSSGEAALSTVSNASATSRHAVLADNGFTDERPVGRALVQQHFDALFCLDYTFQEVKAAIKEVESFRKSHPAGTKDEMAKHIDKTYCGSDGNHKSLCRSVDGMQLSSDDLRDW